MFKKLALPLRILGGIFLLFSGVVIILATLRNPGLEASFGPRWELALIGVECLLAGGYAIWQPAWPGLPRLVLAVAFWLALAVLINWSAYAPGLHVLTLGNPAAASFTTLALVWDILIVWFLFKTIKGYF